MGAHVRQVERYALSSLSILLLIVQVSSIDLTAPAGTSNCGTDDCGVRLTQGGLE